jgi:signal transduction histidine kinase
MLPAYQFGLFSQDSKMPSIITKVFGATQEIYSLESSQAARRFLSQGGMGEWKILVANYNSLQPFELFLTELRTLPKDRIAHLVLLGHSDELVELQSVASREDIHIVDVGQTQALAEVEHHFHGIKTSLDLNWVNSKTAEVLRVYEEVRAKEIDVGKAALEFIQVLNRIMGSRSIDVFLLQTNSTEFGLTASTGKAPITSINRAVMEECFDYSVSGVTSIAHAKDLERIGINNEADGPIAILSRFKLETIPAFILYIFERGGNAELLRELCNTSSREIFHLYRSRQVGAQYSTLKALTEIGNLDAEKRDVLFRILFHLKLHFQTDGVAIVELTQNQNGQFEFEKTYVERANKGTTTFPAEKGFANHSVFNKKALLITECFEEESQPFGRGYEFDIDRLGLDEGSEVVVPTIRTDESFEDEKSLMYFPFRHGELVGAVKLSSFTKVNSFNLFQLRSLGIFAEPIASVLKNIRSVSKLRSEIQLKTAQDKMLAQAEVLFFYREIALGIFHQVGNHLATIDSEMMMLQLVADAQGAGLSPVKEHVEEAKTQLRLARDLIRKAQRRGQHLKPISQNCELIDDILRPAIDYAKKRVGESNIEIKHALTNDHYYVQLDVDLAKESVINILNNAITAVKATKGSKKEVFIGVREITGRKEVEVKIVDTGVGIDPLDFPKLFTPFFTTRPGGTGLGLYFTRKLVEHFEGSVSIMRSQPGKGTTVVITLPLAETE